MRDLVRGLGLLVGLALPAVAYGDLCPEIGSPELSSYVVREIRFETPFDFLGQLRAQLDELRPQLPQQEGRPYDDGAITRGRALIENLGGHADDALPVYLRRAVASIENCDGATTPKSLDVVYSLFTSRIPGYSSGTPEAVAMESADPVQGAGLDRDQRFSLSPRLAYNRAAKTQLGAAFDMRRVGVVESLSLDALGSVDSASADAAAGGSLLLEQGWLRQLDWSAGYQFADLPSDGGRLEKSLARAQVSALSASLGDSGVLLRAGGAFERGIQDSEFAQNELPDGTRDRTHYTGFKLFAGVSWRGQGQTFGASYGLQLGSKGDGFDNGFRKQVVDLSYQVRWLPRDFTPHELDLRLSAGAIDDRGGLPVSERFFGGNVPTPFLAGEAWQINAAPVIRSFAQNELARAGSNAAGGKRFLSFNLTYAPNLWNIPLLPQELRDDDEFEQSVNGQLDAAEITLRGVYASRDPVIRQIREMTAEQERLKEPLAKAFAVYQAIEDEDKGELEEQFIACMDLLNDVQELMLPKMSASSLDIAAGQIQAVLRPGGALDDLRECAADLKPLLGPDIDAPMAALEPPAAALKDVYAKFDPMSAEHSAKSDLTFARRVIDRFFHELNLAAVSPVLLFDAARIGPSVPGESDFRLGIGAGIRFTLASSARFTLAYSVNPNRQSGERRGALLISLDVVDLFY